MNTPAHLYHYTNIDSLALILKNKTIRLNSLDKLDDLQEKETADMINYGQFFYVSSWTEDESESIPMWNIYTNIESGVRIKLITNPFKWYEETLSSIVARGLKISRGSTGISTLLPLDELIKKGCFSTIFFTGDILRKIVYTNDKSKLYPSINKSDDSKIELELGSIGIYKNLHWSFQREWRYIIPFFPVKFHDRDSMQKNFHDMLTRVCSGIETQPFSCFDLQIDEKAFFEMEITLSPKISTGNRELIVNTINRYNPKAKITDSELIGLI